jgi:hypothetical protein
VCSLIVPFNPPDSQSITYYLPSNPCLHLCSLWSGLNFFVGGVVGSIGTALTKTVGAGARGGGGRPMAGVGR